MRLKSLWDEYEARITPEAKMVKDLDLFELSLQAVEYERRTLHLSHSLFQLDTHLSVESDRKRRQNASSILRLDSSKNSTFSSTGVGSQLVSLSPCDRHKEYADQSTTTE